MKLYHGTNVSFDVIDINKSKPFKEFAQGMYMHISRRNWTRPLNVLK